MKERKGRITLGMGMVELHGVAMESAHCSGDCYGG